MNAQSNGAIPDQSLNTTTLNGAAEAINPAASPPAAAPDPSGGGRMSKRTYWLTLGLILAAIFVLIYTLDINRPVPEPPAPAKSGGTGENLNWPQARSESVASAAVTVAPVPTAAPASTPVASTSFNQFRTQQISQIAARPPDPLNAWRKRSYLTALQAPITVGSAHAGSTLELPRQDGAGIIAQPNTGTPQTSNTYNTAAAQYHPPAPPYTIMAGTVIPALLITGITSDAPAQALAQVAQSVYDTATGRYLLIPQGSRVIGDYSTSVGYGQSRIAINWRRLILPDTASIDLPSVPATDMAGYGGLSDQVNNHYLKQFGTAAVISLINAGQMVGQLGLYGGNYGYGAPYGGYGYGINNTGMMGLMGGAAMGQQLGQVAQGSLQRGTNIPPTINIRPGFPLNIELTTDVTLPGAYTR